MSLKQIKNTLEAYLIANVTTTAIKMHNTTFYTLNNVALTQAQIDALKLYIEPKMIPIMQDRELMSSATPINYESFLQIDICTDAGDGMGTTFTLIAALDALFREKTISGVVCLRTQTLNSFEVGGIVVTPYRILASLRAG